MHLSIHFVANRTIKVPIDRAYKGLLEIDSAKHWMQGIVDMKRLDEGPMRIGSQWIETRKMYGTKASEHFEVMDLDEPNKIVLRCDGTKGTTGKGEFLFTYTLSSLHEGTHITLDGEINGLTGFSKLMGKLIVRTFKKACEKDLLALQQHLEKNLVHTSN